MSRFEEDADRIVALVGEGLSLTDACSRAGVPYATVRKWITAGRRDPDGTYGEWVRKLDAARAGVADGDDTDSSTVDESTPGPVESRVDALVSGRDLNRQVDLAAQQAKALARKIDQLSATPGAASAQAMTLASRRLQELVPALEAPREDELDKLRAKFHARRSSMKAGYGWTSHAEAEELDASSNGKGSDL